MSLLGLSPFSVTQGNFSSTVPPLAPAARSGRPTHRSPEPYQEPVVPASTAGRWFAGVAAVFVHGGFAAPSGAAATCGAAAPHPARNSTALTPTMARNTRI